LNKTKIRPTEQMTEFLEEVQEILELEQSLKSFDPSTKLSALGADSLKMASVGALVEETYDRPLYKNDLMEMTVGFLVNLSEV